MKYLFVFILIIVSNLLHGQNFDKLWEPLQKRIDKGESFSNTEINSFLTTHDKLLSQHLIEKSILIDFLGTNAFHEGKYQQSIDYFNHAIDITKQINDTIYRAFYQYDMACVYNHVGYYADAEQLFFKSLPTLAAVYGQNSIEYTMRFKILAEMYVEMGNYDYAQSMNDALIAYFKTSKGEQDHDYLVCLNNDARISQGRGDYKKAIETFNKILEIKKKQTNNDTVAYATLLNNTAEVHRLTGNYHEAFLLLNEAKSLLSEFNQQHVLSLATIYNNLSLCYKNTDDYESAEKLNNKFILIYESLNLTYSPDYSTSLNNQAELYRNLGRYKQAGDLLKKVLFIREQSVGVKHQNYANALNNLALLFFDEGLYAEAESEMLKAKIIYAEVLGKQHPFYANAINTLAMIYIQQRRYKEAEALKTEALQIMKETVGETHERYAYFLGGTVSLYEAMGKYDLAIENTLKSNEIIKNKFGEQHSAYVDGQFNLAYFYSKTNQYVKAQQFYLSSLQFYKKQFNSYFESMSEDDQLAQYQVLADRFETFNCFVTDYVTKFPKQNHHDLLTACFNYQLFLKSLLLSKSIKTRQSVLASSDTALISMYKTWISTKQQLAENFRQVDLQASYWNMTDLEKKSSDIEQQIKTKIKDFGVMEEYDVQKIKSALLPDQAAVFIVKEERLATDSTDRTEYIALILKKNDLAPKLITLSGSQKFESDYYDDYLNKIYDREDDILSYNRFWKPLSIALTGINKVYLSADGVYNQLSLYALKNPLSHKYVIDEIEIALLPNLTALYNKPLSNSSKTADLYGFPDYDYDFSKKTTQLSASDALAVNRYALFKLVPLPGTKQEVENISSYLEAKQWQVNVFERELASEEQLSKTSSPKVLHIATHGYFLKDVYESDDNSFFGFESYKVKLNPLLQSGILLAGAAKDSVNAAAGQDGIVTAYDASLLNLANTDLVVLSACETGLGHQMNNQGVFGLQRAFYVAGAKNMIMSLWSVDDEATQLLMSTFYKEWSLKSTPDKIAPAFKKAQTEVRKKYPHPYYWAAFTLLGN